jgi:hypothetical protein
MFDLLKSEKLKNRQLVRFKLPVFLEELDNSIIPYLSRMLLGLVHGPRIP